VARGVPGTCVYGAHVAHSLFLRFQTPRRAPRRNRRPPKVYKIQRKGHMSTPTAVERAALRPMSVNALSWGFGSAFQTIHGQGKLRAGAPPNVTSLGHFHNDDVSTGIKEQDDVTMQPKPP